MIKNGIWDNLSLKDMPTETWKDVPGWEGLYAVSDLGRVKSLKRPMVSPNPGITYYKDKILRQQHVRNEYLRARLCRDGKVFNFLLHRLVGLSFIPNEKGYKEINHIDGCKHNNKKDNLEWCNRSQNIQHAFDTGLAKGIKGFKWAAKLTKKQVIKIKILLEKDIDHAYISESFGISRRTVRDIKSGRTWSDVIIED
jgi:hypothetical protein